MSQQNVFKQIQRQLKFTHIQFFLLTTFCASSAVDVVWEADFPAVFGNVTYLQCNISDAAFNCSKRTRQWIGGPNYRSLCYEDKCTTSNKYEVMEQPKCQYTLMIHNFSEQDVNCEYTCSYGVSRMRQNLTLDKKRFIYEPQVKDIEESLTKHGRILNWKINISKIFPTPSCGANLNGESLTDPLPISVTESGFYYTAALQIQLPVSSCGNVYVYCYLGNYKVNITTKNFNSCHLQEGEIINKDNTLVMGLIIFGIILVIAVFLGCMYREEKLCFKTIRGRFRRLFML